MKCYMNLRDIPENGIEIVRENGLLRVMFDFEEYATVDEGGDELKGLRCELVDVHGRTYSDLVAAIVNSRYDADDTLAILANKQLAEDGEEEKRDEHLAKYAAFQEWRSHAKEIANTVLEML